MVMRASTIFRLAAKTASPALDMAILLIALDHHCTAMAVIACGKTVTKVSTILGLVKMTSPASEK
eukprot:4223503-Ditylum_brightwellii.AAC.1